MSEGRLQRFLVADIVAATALAVIETFGLVLVVPLVQLLQGDDQLSVPVAGDLMSDLAGDGDPLTQAARVGLLIFLVFFLKGALTVLYLRWSIDVVLEEEAQVSAELLEGYLRAPYRLHISTSPSARQAILNDAVHRIYADGLIGVVAAVADIAVMVLITAALLMIEPWITLFAAAYLIAVAVGYQRFVHGRADTAGRAFVSGLERCHRIVDDSLSAFKLISVGNLQTRFGRELLEAKRRTVAQHGALMFIYRVPRYLLELALLVGVGLLAAGLLSRPADEAAAALGLFLTAGFRLIPGLNRVLGATASVRSLRGVADTVQQQLKEGRCRRLASGSPAKRDAGDVRFDGVSFRYGPTEPDVLRHVDLEIDRGQYVAIIGGSGQGKSTLLDLLLGLLEPTDGQILIDGEPMGRQMPEWQASLGYVPQETVIIDDTLRRNIALGADDAEINDDLVRSCLDAAALSSLVTSLEEGLATRLLDGGARLSGGERQRVGLARALYRRPGTLVLDEVTSSLDLDTERSVMTTISGLAGQRTVVMVTHRLSTVNRCDTVYVLRNGGIAWSGPPADLDDELVSELGRSAGATEPAPAVDRS